MKKLTSLLIGCSLALAGAALAQQPVEQQSPSKGKRAPEKTHAATQGQPGANAVKPEGRPGKQTGAMKEQGAMHQPGAMKERGMTNERGAMNQPGAGKGQKAPVHQESATAPGTNVSGQQVGGATNEPGAGKGRKGRAHEKSENAPATGTDVSGRAAGMPTQVGKEQQVKERKQGVKQPAGANAVLAWLWPIAGDNGSAVPSNPSDSAISPCFIGFMSFVASRSRSSAKSASFRARYSPERCCSQASAHPSLPHYRFNSISNFRQVSPIHRVRVTKGSLGMWFVKDADERDTRIATGSFAESLVEKSRQPVRIREKKCCAVYAGRNPGRRDRRSA